MASQAKHLPNTSKGCKTALEELELTFQALWLGKGENQKSHRLPLALLEEMWSLGTYPIKPPPAWAPWGCMGGCCHHRVQLWGGFLQ